MRKMAIRGEIDELAKKVLIEHFSDFGFSCVDDKSNQRRRARRVSVRGKQAAPSPANVMVLCGGQ